MHIPRCLLVFVLVGLSLAAHAEPTGAQPYSLAAYPDARVGYSLRKLTPAYEGSAVRVRRASDHAERDVGFVGDDLDVATLETWLAGSDGFVVRWYNQVPGAPALVQPQRAHQPRLATAGAVLRDAKGLPRLRFEAARETHLRLATDLTPALATDDLLLLFVSERVRSDNPTEVILSLTEMGSWPHYTLQMGYQNGGFTTRQPGQQNWYRVDGDRATRILNFHRGTVTGYRNNERTDSDAAGEAVQRATFVLGVHTKSENEGFNGYLSEVLFYPSRADDPAVQALYDLTNAYWRTGPVGYHSDTLLPQKWAYQVTLYDWLKTLTPADVTLPEAPLRWDQTYQDVDHLADIWLGMSASLTRVVRAEPRWFVLDDGAGGGIEGTGAVRIMHTTGKGESKSWANEPAFWYQFELPMANGSSGNPYYKHPALAYRALVLAAIDMMMYDREADTGNYADWNDMFGKAMLAWAEAYAWCRDVLDPATQAAFEAGLGRFLDRSIRNGPRDANTNMDIFAVQAAARIYDVTTDPALRDRALRAVKRILLGYPDGEIGVRHDVLEGTYFPAGYIGEGDGPETTYNGVSYYHIMGAWSLVHDDPAWAFLGEIARSMTAFKVYQYFKDPARGVDRPEPFYTGPAGYANRTGGPMTADQDAQHDHRDLTAAYFFEEGRSLIRNAKFDRLRLLSERGMIEEINDKVANLTANNWGVTYEGMPPVWSGWEPWVKENAYLPPHGWYTTLQQFVEADDPAIYYPYDRPGYAFNKAFGGPPTGYEFWAYKQTSGTNTWGFFVEADAQQSSYPGWYGGKLEAFWTDRTGLLILNMHDKTGGKPADRENTLVWSEIDQWAAHHVWGRTVTGAFSTVHVRGRTIPRESVFATDEPAPYVEVHNVFNDPQINLDNEGQQKSAVFEGRVQISNRFDAIPNGIRVTHTLQTDRADQATELWATLPVYLRHHLRQSGLADTAIEYWDGAAWRPLGTTLVATTSLRLGRDFGQGPAYGYVTFDTPQRVKLSAEIWVRTYQAANGGERFRNVHVDLHGNPGTPQTLPSVRSLSYTITAVEPAAGKTGTSLLVQALDLQQGWNMVSASVRPTTASLDAVFAGVQDNLVVVKDENGQMYAPEFGVNMIGTWDPREAYQLYIREAAQVTLEGIPLDPASLPIPLTQGWNMLPYPRDTAMPIAEALASIQDAILFVKDNDGHIFYPEQGIDLIQSLEPGRGYKIFLTSDATLVYPTN